MKEKKMSVLIKNNFSLVISDSAKYMKSLYPYLFDYPCSNPQTLQI